jgi:hypothetical protein
VDGKPAECAAPGLYCPLEAGACDAGARGFAICGERTWSFACITAGDAGAGD